MPHSLQQIESLYYQYEQRVQEITSPFDNRLILMVNMPQDEANKHLVQLLRNMVFEKIDKNLYEDILQCFFSYHIFRNYLDV